MSVEVKERPIIISGPMVCAILRGEKTQTRRVMNPQPEDCNFCGPEVYESTKVDRYGEVYPGPKVCGIYHPDGEWGIVCPYGKPGDRLWVRETWLALRDNHYHNGLVKRDTMTKRCNGVPVRAGAEYRADSDGTDESNRCREELGYVWRPSIHMPRWASRITLEVTDVRVERVQDISEADAIAEGVTIAKSEDGTAGYGDDVTLHRHPQYTKRWGFKHLWDEINAKRGYSWASNPWVWCVSFKVV